MLGLAPGLELWRGLGLGLVKAVAVAAIECLRLQVGWVFVVAGIC